LTNSITDN